jgi:hypothetical protein
MPRLTGQKTVALISNTQRSKSLARWSTLELSQRNALGTFIHAERAN